jgi:hypothetical protein
MLALGLVSVTIGVALFSLAASFIVAGLALTALAVSEAMGDVLPRKIRRPKP